MAFVEWETSQKFFDELDKEFGFTLDVCANEQNAKIANYYSSNSWDQEWSGVCWMNPPYDKTINIWMEKAYVSALEGATVVCLIQGRSTDTAWWHEYAMRASEIRFIRDRLRFGMDGKFSRANISSVLVIFRPGYQGHPTIGRTYDGRNYIP